MKNILILTNDDVKEAIVAHVAKRCGVTVEPESVTIKLEREGQFDDVEYHPDGAEVELPIADED